MSLNLNIISLTVSIVALWTMSIQSSFGYCSGCSNFYSKLPLAAKEINDRHAQLEIYVKQYYENEILPRLEEIDQLQKKITQTSVHLFALEKEANTDDKKLLFLLKKAMKSATKTVEVIQ